MRFYFGVTIIIVFSFLYGCISTKNSSSRNNVIHGHYEVMNQEPYEANGNAIITGVIYDKKSGQSLGFSFVQIKEKNKGAVADTLGKFNFEVPSGIYRLEAFNTGNTALLTTPITFEANTKTEIVFYLGTFWID